MKTGNVTDLACISHLDFDPEIPCASGDKCGRPAVLAISGTGHYAHRMGTPPPPLPLCVECWDFRVAICNRAGLLTCPCGASGYLFPTFVGVFQELR